MRGTRIEKITKRPKSKNRCSPAEIVQIIVCGIRPQGESETMVERICQREIGFKPRVTVREL